jgi:pantoate--beta-alanine ligase
MAPSPSPSHLATAPGSVTTGGRTQLVETVAETRSAVAEARRQGDTVGFVPTMGALHAGHLTLIRTARRECDFLAVSIFVNRPQFGPSEDFGAYPRPLEEDLEICRSEGVQLVFAPHEQAIYPEDFRTWLHVGHFGDVLEGEFRPGHFRGVATVVLELLNIVGPDRAYFGEKDYQQLLLVRQLVRDLNVPVEIRGCPLVREPDGLAASSRNRRLGPEQREWALALYRSLILARDMVQAGERDVNDIRQRMRDLLENTPDCSLDYAELVDPETLDVATALNAPVRAVVAARVGKVRLIDNMLLEPGPVRAGEQHDKATP